MSAVLPLGRRLGRARHVEAARLRLVEAKRLQGRVTGGGHSGLWGRGRPVWKGPERQNREHRQQKRLSTHAPFLLGPF